MILFSLLMLLVLLVPITACAEDLSLDGEYNAVFGTDWPDIVVEGECGPNINWKIDVNGVIYFWGLGDMPNYNPVPWSRYKSDLTYVAIDIGISSICKLFASEMSSFRRCS